MDKAEAAKLAEIIATEILTVYESSSEFPLLECTRAQMMIETEDGTERNMGGRNKKSIAEIIEQHLVGSDD